MNKKTVLLLSNIFPSFFAKRFYHRLLHPQIKKMQKQEVDVLAKDEKEMLSINNNNIQLYKWGNAEKKILLVHGWEGQAGNYSDLIEKLLVHQYTVYAFDGPGHGNSSGGKNIMYDYLDLVAVIITKLTIKNIVSHSFGSVVSTYSLAKIPHHKIEKIVLLTTPHTFSNYLLNISQKIGISDKAVQLFLKRVEGERKEKITDFDVSKFVQKANIESALIIHDINDKVIPISEAEAVDKDWDNATLQKITDTGHFKILRSLDVTNTIIEFMESKRL